MENNVEKRWDKRHAMYTCVDGLRVLTKRAKFNRIRYEDPALDFTPDKRQMFQRSRTPCGPGHTTSYQQRLFVSGIEFDRKLSQIARAIDSVTTVTFPGTVALVLDGAFRYASLRSVVLNEGLEQLGECGINIIDRHRGVFSNTLVKSVILPSTLRVLGDSTFSLCESLERVVIACRSQLKTIGEQCFRGSGIEQIVLPKTVEEIRSSAFSDCSGLKTIYVERGSDAVLSEAQVPSFAQVGPLPETTVDRVWDLRGCKQVVIPNGTQKIWNHWFWGSEIESVTVPASVVEIGAEAFGNCKCLKVVTFKEESRLRMIKDNAFWRCAALASINLPVGLKNIGIGCFSESGLEEIALPASVREVGANAFDECKQLKRVKLNEGLERLGLGKIFGNTLYEGRVFSGTAIASIRLPSTLKRIEAETFYQCQNLSNVEISRGVECIGERCFDGCRIEEITLPSTLREIGEDAFACNDLKAVWVEEGCALDIKKYVDDTVEIMQK